MFEVTIHAKCETVDEALHLLNELEDCVGKNNADLEDSNVLNEDGDQIDEVVLPSLWRRPPKPNVGDLVHLKDDKMAKYVGTFRPTVIKVYDTLDEDWGDHNFMAKAQRTFEEEIGETSAWYAIVGGYFDGAVVGDHEVTRIFVKRT